MKKKHITLNEQRQCCGGPHCSIDYNPDTVQYTRRALYMCQYVLNIEHRCDIGHKTNYSIGFHNRYAIMYIYTHYMRMMYCAVNACRTASSTVRIHIHCVSEYVLNCVKCTNVYNSMPITPMPST